MKGGRGGGGVACARTIVRDEEHYFALQQKPRWKKNRNWNWKIKQGLWKCITDAHKSLMESAQGYSVLSEDYWKPPIQMLSSHAASTGLENIKSQEGREGCLSVWKGEMSTKNTYRDAAVMNKWEPGHVNTGYTAFAVCAGQLLRLPSPHRVSSGFLWGTSALRIELTAILASNYDALGDLRPRQRHCVLWHCVGRSVQFFMS